MKVTSVLYVYLFLCMINFIKTDDDDSDDYSEDAEDNYDDADDDKHDSAMDIIEDMEDGIGGLTVANYGGTSENVQKIVRKMNAHKFAKMVQKHQHKLKLEFDYLEKKLEQNRVQLERSKHMIKKLQQTKYHGSSKNEQRNSKQEARLEKMKKRLEKNQKKLQERLSIMNQNLKEDRDKHREHMKIMRETLKQNQSTLQENLRIMNQKLKEDKDKMNQTLEQNQSALQERLKKMRENIKKNQEKHEERMKKMRQDLEDQRRAREIKKNMANGIGGSTVATYGDKFTIVLINGKKYVCPGELLTNKTTKRAYCSKPLSTKLTSQMLICSNNSYNRINDMFCFGNVISMSCNNNDCKCEGGVAYTLKGLKNLCGDNYATSEYVKFIYYPKKTDPNYIPLPITNKYVTCQDEGENAKVKCTWYSS